MTLLLGGVEISAADIVATLGELIIPERALLQGLTWRGPKPQVVMTVENLGAYVDLPKDSSMLVLYLPGFNTRLGRAALQWLGSPRIVHFGDLDPSGFMVWRRLCEWFGEVEWFVPEFWGEHIAERGRKCEWPLIEVEVPALVAELVRSGRWLEQELVIGDPRLAGEVGRVNGGKITP